jgi:hypothetical protein
VEEEVDVVEEDDDDEEDDDEKTTGDADLGNGSVLKEAGDLW